MAASTVPAAKASLLDAIKTRAQVAGPLAQAHIDWVPPTDNVQHPTRVWLEDARDIDREFVNLGGQRMEEVYVIGVVVEHVVQGSDAQGAEEAMWVLVDEVERIIRADLSDSNALQWRKPQPAEPVLAVTDDKSLLARCSVRVECHARI